MLNPEFQILFLLPVKPSDILFSISATASVKANAPKKKGELNTGVHLSIDLVLQLLALSVFSDFIALMNIIEQMNLYFNPVFLAVLTEDLMRQRQACQKFHENCFNVLDFGKSRF